MTCVAFSIKFVKLNQKFAENSEFCEKNSLLEREARVGTIRKTTNGHHQLALALTHHGVREKRKKLQEEKSVNNTSSTCSIIRKMPQKPTESDLKIWYSSISQNVRKLVVNREINSQVPLVAEPHRGD